MQIAGLAKIKIANVLKILKAGGVVVAPTETCYGLFADATSGTAVRKVIKYKSGLVDRGIPIFVATSAAANDYVYLTKTAKHIYTQFLPGPVTVISNSRGKLADGVASPEGTQAVRVSSHPFVATIAKEYKLPITATAANIPGKGVPYSVDKLIKDLPTSKLELLDLVVDAGELPHNPPTTMIDAHQDGMTTFRQGALNLRSIASYDTNEVDETIKLAKRLTNEWVQSAAGRPILIILNGALGAGKTHFAKGVAAALGVQEQVKSPTYIYEVEYDTQNSSYKKLYHLDPWRLEAVADLDLLWRPELFASKVVTVVEWPEVFATNLQELNKQNLFAVAVTINYTTAGRNLIVSELV